MLEGIFTLIVFFFVVYGFSSFNKDRKYQKDRQDLINDLERQNYLHTDYGDEILRDFDRKHGRGTW